MGLSSIPVGSIKQPEPDKGWTWSGALTEDQPDAFEFISAPSDEDLLRPEIDEADIAMINNPSDEDLLTGATAADAGMPSEADLDMVSDFAVDIPIDYGLPVQF